MNLQRRSLRRSAFYALTALLLAVLGFACEATAPSDELPLGRSGLNETIHQTPPASGQ